jgi:hypothetical protein
MKGILYLFLVPLLGAGSVSAQGAGYSPWPDSGRFPVVGPRVNKMAMAPDRMPCLTPDVTGLDRMPILRSSNSDPMPNGLRHPGRRILGRPGPVLIKPDEK